MPPSFLFFFFFNDTATTEIYTLSLHDALPIAHGPARRAADGRALERSPVRQRELPTEYRAEAPLRLDLAGGWTDVPPFSQREGGVVVSAAIGLYARVELRLGGKLIRLGAEELDQTVEMVNSGGLVADGRLPLHKAGLRMFPVSFPCTL